MAGARNGKTTAKGSRARSVHQPTASSSSPAPQQENQPHTPVPTPVPKDGASTRQKRVLPTRARRGGPVVGTCESDVMILETMRRKFESEPLIPTTTSFLLTTNSALLRPPPAASTSSTRGEEEKQLNTLAYGRYFDRPEVRKAYKEQLLIQTPDFTELPQDAHVGGRFRPRGSEDEAHDTSDAVYEKRHRKYEMFEKRQRLREKEKLKHEHYKLKERIDQLRAMDNSAFLALSASDFSEPPDDLPGPSVQSPSKQQLDDFGEPHSTTSYHEGERRRKEMLEVALSLEERYRILLPPDRRWMLKKKTGKPVNHLEPIEIDDTDDGMVDGVEEPEGGGREKIGEEMPEVDELQDDEAGTAADEKMEIDLVEEEEVDELESANGGAEDEPTVAPSQDEDGESEIDPDELELNKSKRLKLRIKFPLRNTSESVKPEVKTPVPLPTRGGGKQISYIDDFAGGDKEQPRNSPPPSASYAQSQSPPPESSKQDQYSIDVTEELPPPPTAKRQRLGQSISTRGRGRGRGGRGGSKVQRNAISGVDGARNSISSASVGRQYSQPRAPSPLRPAHASYAGLAGRKEPNPCVLMVAALRQSSAPMARKTQRNVTAFGARVPPEIEEVRDFEVPDWVLAKDSASEDGDHDPDDPASSSSIEFVDDVT